VYRSAARRYSGRAFPRDTDRQRGLRQRLVAHAERRSDQAGQYVESAEEAGVVRFLGRLDSVASLLQATDLFLLPSQTESFGLAALEAMACGSPVVASRAGGLPEVIDDAVNGILEPVGSVEAMGRRAVELLRDAPRYAAMREAAIAKARQFSTDRIVPMYEQVYEEVLRGRPAMSPADER